MSSNAPSKPVDPARRRNVRLGVICAAVFVGMIGAAYASVPLYDAFCRATGFGGRVERADVAPTKVLDQTVEVRFDVNVDKALPWVFEAEQRSQTLKIGETGMAFFKVTNTSDKPHTGQAVYNVVPTSVGAYLRKLECFCFTEQTLQPGQTMEFPMVYFIDPGFADDFETKGTKEVTLSYTFFPAVKQAAATSRADASQAKLASGLGGTASTGL
jgi:cytochrome c oxidase assembly protein subunit 11